MYTYAQIKELHRIITKEWQPLSDDINILHLLNASTSSIPFNQTNANNWEKFCTDYPNLALLHWLVIHASGLHVVGTNYDGITRDYVNTMFDDMFQMLTPEQQVLVDGPMPISNTRNTISGNAMFQLWLLYDNIKNGNSCLNCNNISLCIVFCKKNEILIY